MPNFSTKNILATFLILFPIAVFYLVFQKYAVNIPHWDDFAIRNTLAQMLETNSFSEKIKLLFSQHNEHRILLTRLSAWVIYLLQGTLNLKSLMFIGLLTLAGLLIIFFQVSKKYNLPLLAFVPVSLILFNVGLFENTFWGMASVQNFGVIFFAFLTFYWLVFSIENPYKNYFYFALFSCLIGVFTSSNGIIIPLIGCFVLLVQQRKKQIFIWLGCSALFIFGFFFNFHKNPDNVVKTNFSGYKTIIKGLFATFGSVLDSSAIAPAKHLDLAMALGLFLLIFVCLFAYQVIFKKYNLSIRTNDLFLLACLAFIGITSVGIVVARISYGIEILLTSKYKIYSVLSLIIFYIVALNSLAERYKNNFVQLATFAGFAFNFYTYIADYQNIRYLNQERITDQFKQQYSENSFPKQGIMQVLQQPEKAFYDSMIDEMRQIKDSTLQHLSVTTKAENFVLTLQKTGEKIDLTSPESGIYFILKSDKNIYLYPSHIKPLGMRAYLDRNFIINNLIKIDNFTAEISKLYIQSGKYQIGTVKVENELKSVIWSTQTIDIQRIEKIRPKQNW
ncbi:hypothetical protein [Emticicia sp. W12TSBA100-4]|uniref:hypothetical protein n=1 Tax=Emticicia sp. W12TSBA100-4 TaxID=3160965 RepID=UPI003305CD37